MQNTRTHDTTSLNHSRRCYLLLTFVLMDMFVTVVFPSDRGRQEHRAAEEKGRGAERGLGEDGEPVGEQRH